MTIPKKVTQKHFEEWLWPHISKCAYMQGMPLVLRVKLWQLIEKGLDYRQIRRVLFEEYAALNLDFERLVAAACGAVHTLDTLLFLQGRGYIQVKGLSSYEACNDCVRDVAEKRFLISDLLAAYVQETPVMPVLPHLGCNQWALGGWCRCIWGLDLAKPPFDGLLAHHGAIRGG
jgi:hypothetical protein